MRARLHRFALVALLLAPQAAGAQDEMPPDYVAHYGDGIRAYTESRYEDALRELYRAFAIKQTPYALKLIIRSHDFLGNCTARERASEMLEDSFSTNAPAPQLCDRVGTLQLSCSTEGKVRVDGNFDAVCGTSILVPVGQHRVVSRRLGASVVVDVTETGTTTASIQTAPSKWYLGDAGPHKWLPNDPVTESELRSDPDMPRKFDIDPAPKPTRWRR